MQEGYVQLQKALLKDQAFVSLPPSYRCVMWTILAYCCYKECSMDDHGQTVYLKAGEFLCTYRYLAELSNVGKKDAENGVNRLIELGFLGQRVGHRKSIFRVLWGVNFYEGGTRSGPSWRQDGDTNNNNNKETPVVSVRKQQQEADACVVFPILETIKDSSIHRKHREEISFKYSEDVVINAVASITEEGFVPEHSLLKSLRAACKGEWKPKIGNDVEKNRKLAKKLEGKRKNYIFEALDKYLEIIIGMRSECIAYKMPYDKFYSEIETVGKIKIKDEVGV